jgi:hypothetical protein
LGERFLKIIFDNAIQYRVDEIYVTLFLRTDAHDRLAKMLQDWGFSQFGVKRTQGGEEAVYVRDFRPRACPNQPQACYPFVSSRTRKFVVPIYPAYHTELLPDSILRTESPHDFVENRPNRNAISKVYVSRSIERSMTSGDLIVFYRTASGGAAYYTSVITTFGVIQEVIANIRSEEEFIELCRKRSVFTDDELREHWRYRQNSRPFIVNFLYLYSFPRRPNLRDLMENGVMSEAPRGFERLSDESFSMLMRITHADARFVVD